MLWISICFYGQPLACTGLASCDVETSTLANAGSFCLDSLGSRDYLVASINCVTFPPPLLLSAGRAASQQYNPECAWCGINQPSQLVFVVSKNMVGYPLKPAKSYTFEGNTRRRVLNYLSVPSCQIRKYQDHYRWSVCGSEIISPKVSARRSACAQVSPFVSPWAANQVDWLSGGPYLDINRASLNRRSTTGDLTRGK